MMTVSRVILALAGLSFWGAFMTKHTGTADRVTRLLIALAVAVLSVTGTIGGARAVLLALVAIAFFATNLVGRCSTYVPLGVSTRKVSGGPGPAA